MPGPTVVLQGSATHELLLGLSNRLTQDVDLCGSPCTQGAKQTPYACLGHLAFLSAGLQPIAARMMWQCGLPLHIGAPGNTSKRCEQGRTDAKISISPASTQSRAKHDLDA